jgi:uncharacterized damage-inducible protein DinB
MLLPLMRQLFEHQHWADGQLLQAVAAHPVAFTDGKLLATLHHIVFVQRVFTALLAATPFDIQTESQPVSSLDALQPLYAASHGNQSALLSSLTEEALARPVENPWVPHLKGTAAEILMQVILHSQNHRGQCLTRLRELSGAAPTLDFIVWLSLCRAHSAAAQ